MRPKGARCTATLHPAFVEHGGTGARCRCLLDDDGSCCVDYQHADAEVSPTSGAGRIRAAWEEAHPATCRKCGEPIWRGGEGRWTTVAGYFCGSPATRHYPRA